ncbi:MAG TPA: protease inhibitor I42 family protein [Lysobacter sp.]
MQEQVPDTPRRQVEQAPTLDVGLANAVDPVRLQVGQILHVHLPASAATGYGWELQQAPASVLDIEADPGGDPLTFVPPRSESGEMSWRFRASAPGSTLLEFRYARPWEAATSATRTEIFRIEVR